MIRSTRDPGPSLLAAVMPVVVVIGAALYLIHLGTSAAVERLDEHTRRQVETAVCRTDAPVRPTSCDTKEEKP